MESGIGSGKEGDTSLKSESSGLIITRSFFSRYLLPNLGKWYGFEFLKTANTNSD